MQLKLNLFVLLLSLIITAYGLARQAADDVQYEFEFIKMNQQWLPITTCKEYFTNASDITCSPCKSSKASNKWTIHGLWPSVKYGPSILYCEDIPFDSDLLSDELKAEMKYKWPSVKYTDENFWAHEWKKHGSCALNLEETNSLPNYFSKTVELYDSFNVENILTNAGIVPNEKYQAKYILQAFQNSLGVNVYLSCIRNEQSRLQFIKEVRMCFDRSFALVDCSPTSSSTGSCTNEYEVTYLESC